MKATWTEEGRVEEQEVASFRDVMALVQRIDSTVKEATVFEVWDPSTGAAVSLVLGLADITALTFQASLDPPYFISHGAELASGSAVEVLHNGEMIEQIGEAFVPKSLGLPVLQAFWERRRKSSAVPWKSL